MTSGEADSLVDRVARQLTLGAVQLGCAPEVAGEVIAEVATLGLWPDTWSFLSSAQAAAIHNLKSDFLLFAKWRDTYRRWAEDGHRDDGSSFTWQRWADLADTIGDDVATQAGVAWEGSGVVVAAETVGATAEQLASPSLWPTWLKVAAAAAVVGVLLVVAGPELGAVRAVTR